jgi:2-polyprenyl-3-methyl-5-hydroxy-6-metoxy-1,4-benzoquinol methylase
MTRAGDANWPRFVCPACRTDVIEVTDGFDCPGCLRAFPILFGIPDFRLRSDRYLSLADEREKAARLHAFSQEASFEETLNYYYTITDDVTVERARVYASYVQHGQGRAALAIEDMGRAPAGSILLDAGCGGGGGVEAAHGRFDRVVGLDVALRWLVIAQKRLKELAIDATLVCADLEAPPFPNETFSHILAIDVIEHVENRLGALAAMRNMLRQDGLVWLSAANRRWLGPHPSVGLWAAGFIPPRLRARIFRRRGYDPLRHVTDVSPSELRQACADAALMAVSLAARRVDAGQLSGRTASVRLLVEVYGVLRRTPFLGALLTAWGPAFQLLARAN